jgi:hypothetical protein
MATDTSPSEPTEECADPDSADAAELDADLEVDADHAGSVRGGATVKPPGGGAGSKGSGGGAGSTAMGSDVHSKTNIVPVAWPDGGAVPKTRPDDGA